MEDTLKQYEWRDTDQCFLNMGLNLSSQPPLLKILGPLSDRFISILGALRPHFPAKYKTIRKGRTRVLVHV